MSRFYRQVAGRAGRTCEYCCAQKRFSNFAFEVEHIVPPFLGGTSELHNLALACRSCNLFKSKYLTGIDGSGRETERLFNPRTDGWHEHFRLDPVTNTLEGLTEIGRGTINRLRMNSEMQVGARSIWTQVEDMIARD